MLDMRYDMHSNLAQKRASLLIVGCIEAYWL